MEIFPVLIREHAELRTQIAGLRAMREASAAVIESALQTFKTLLLSHFQKEETIYRDLDQNRTAANRAFVHHLRNDHAAMTFGIESLLIRLRKNGPKQEWWDHFEKLMLVYEPHMEQEEKEFFPGVSQ